MQHGFAYDTMRRAEAYRHHHGLGGAAGAAGAGGSGGGGSGGDAQADQLVLQHSLAVSSVPSLDQQVMHDPTHHSMPFVPTNPGESNFRKSLSESSVFEFQISLFLNAAQWSEGELFFPVVLSLLRPTY